MPGGNCEIKVGQEYVLTEDCGKALVVVMENRTRTGWIGYLLQVVRPYAGFKAGETFEVGYAERHRHYAGWELQPLADVDLFPQG